MTPEEMHKEYKRTEFSSTSEALFFSILIHYLIAQSKVIDDLIARIEKLEEKDTE
jgi:hypothetical protein